MPYILINKLKKLMDKDFPSQLDTNNPVLGKIPTDLSDDVLDLIDDISDTAHQLFGPRIQPVTQQVRTMEENGFQIKGERVVNGTWFSGCIVTPKGHIVYM